MRKFVLTVLMVCCSGAHAAGIPVFDASTFAQAVQSITQLKKQVENQVSQIKEQQKQFSAISGGRNLGSILNDPKLKQHLPGEWKDIYDKVKKGEIPGINASAITAAEGLSSTNAETQRYYDTLAANKAINMSAYDKTLDRLNNIQDLMKRIDTSTDAKSSADLMARLAAEQAMIQNEQTRIDLMAKLQDAQLKIVQEKQMKDFRSKYFK